MIECSEVCFSYDQKNLFTNISTVFEKGKIYGLLGKNGAGKTTLLKLLTGLLYPKSGTILIDDINASSRKVDTIEKMFFIPESYYIPGISVKKYIKLYSGFYPKFSIDEFMIHCEDLEINYNGFLSSFSYGQKKKFLLAYGLAANTDIMIFDEPTNGLDIPSKRSIRKKLASSLHENKLIFISTHQVRDLENIFDSLVILDHGKIILNKSIDEITSKVTIKLVPHIKDENNPYYYEEIPGGYAVLLPKEKEESNIDIEFFFNACLNLQNKIQEIIQ